MIRGIVWLYHFVLCKLGKRRHYSATGLPAGLRLDPVRGTIKGTPQEPGKGEITIHVHYGTYEASPIRITYNIKPTHMKASYYMNPWI